MKPVLFFTAALLLAVGPALAQEAPAPAPAPPPPPTDRGNAPQIDTHFRIDQTVKACFSVGPVSGANRAGAKTVYVQNRKGGVFRLDLADPCDALDSARAISVQSRGFQVCEGEQATLLVKTEAGAKRCAIREVIRPTKAEITKMASAQR